MTIEIIFTIVPRKKIYPYLSILILLLIFSLLVYGVMDVEAQEPNTPYYVVQPGDSLWEISSWLGIPLEDLESANGITNPDQLTARMKLFIPGLVGITGEISPQEIPFSDNLYRLSRRYGIPQDVLVQLNHLTSPVETYAGASFLLPAGNENNNHHTVSLAPGQSVLELAVSQNINPWLLRLNNAISADWDILPGEDLYAPGQGTKSNRPESAPSVSIDSVKLSQGKTVEVRVVGPQRMKLKGILGDYQLNFFPTDDGYVALQGIHAMADSGLVSLEINGEYPASAPFFAQEFSFSQSLVLQSGDYPFDPVLIVNPETIDPVVTKPEDGLWKSLGTVVTPDKLWDGAFVSPVPDVFKDCWTSLFGNRRSYNNGPYDFFHSGLDFCGQEGTELYAPAGGRVVFAGALTVRGNATVIDHGWGVYTAYDHQSQQFVKVGDEVKPGQLIGLGGATGRVTGPHLHWEVWVGGVQVDPVDWLNKAHP